MKSNGHRVSVSVCVVLLSLSRESWAHGTVKFIFLHFLLPFSHSPTCKIYQKWIKRPLRSPSQHTANAPLWSSCLPEEASYSVYSIFLLLFILFIALRHLSHYAFLFCVHLSSSFCLSSSHLHPFALANALSRCPVLFRPIFHNASEARVLFNKTWDFGSQMWHIALSFWSKEHAKEPVDVDGCVLTVKRKLRMPGL